MNWNTVWIAAGCFAALASSVWLAWRVVYWTKQGNLLRTKPGYRTPDITLAARVTRAIVGRLAAVRYIGPMTVIGRENLRYGGRLIIMPNHQFEQDAVVMAALLGTMHYRGMMAVSQIHGIRTPLAAWGGIIAVHSERNPAAAARSTIRIMEEEEDSSLVIFPQGRLVRDNHLDPTDFHRGSAMIGKKICQSDRVASCDIAALPVAIHYIKRDQAKPSPLTRLSSRLGLRLLNQETKDEVFGAVVAVGKPLPFSELPDDYQAATDIIFARLAELDKQAQATASA